MRANNNMKMNKLTSKVLIMMQIIIFHCSYGYPGDEFWLLQKQKTYLKFIRVTFTLCEILLHIYERAVLFLLVNMQHYALILFIFMASK